MDIIHKECDDLSIVQSHFLHLQLPNILFTTVSKTNDI